MPQVVAGFSSDTESAAYLMDRRFWITAFMYGIIPVLPVLHGSHKSKGLWLFHFLSFDDLIP